MKRFLLLLFLLMSFYAEAQHILPKSHYKYKVIEDVYNDIYRAWGQNRIAPELVVYTPLHVVEADQLARYYPVQNKISVGEKLYDLCQTFGADSLHALACVLGHELAHFMKGHSQEAGGYGLQVKSQGSITPAERLSYEQEADQWGLFYGTLAGYETYRVLGAVIERIYETYRLKDNSPSYPTKAERMASTKNTVIEGEKLSLCFKAGMGLYVLKQYQEAALCFEYILRQFPSKEIYNNAGLCHLMEVYIFQKTNDYAYPLVFDTQSQLYHSPNRSGEGDDAPSKETIKEKLGLAERYFKNALAIDDAYEASSVNVSCLYSLVGNQEAAIGEIKRLESKTATLSSSAYLVRGIARALTNQTDLAKEDMEKAKAHPLTAINKELLDGKDLVSIIMDFFSVESYGKRKPKGNLPEEPLYKILTDLGKQQTVQPNVVISPSAQIPLQLNSYVSASHHYLQANTKTKKTAWVEFVNLETSTSQLGVKKGFSKEQVMADAAYGEPTYQVQLGNMEYLCYESGSLVFELRKGRVVGWWVYKK